MKTVAIHIDHVNNLVVFEDAMGHRTSLGLAALNRAVEFAVFCERSELTASALTRQQFAAKYPTIKLPTDTLACETFGGSCFIG